MLSLNMITIIYEQYHLLSVTFLSKETYCNLSNMINANQSRHVSSYAIVPFSRR